MWARVKSAKRKIKNLGEHPILVDPDQGQDLVVADADGLFMDLILLGIERSNHASAPMRVLAAPNCKRKFPRINLA